ncbi:MAG: glycolate oxidase subunit GlcE [Pseudomonadota bacterium]|nr:glycolate oxidase subunit GlcE [Pseudomonadota bacterium]
MVETLRPESTIGVLDAVKWAVAEETPLDVIGAGSKAVLGRSVGGECRLDLSALKGIEAYEPNELVLVAKPATLISEIERALRENNQQMAFEPADLGPMLGGAASAGTIGGAIACNITGPRRIKAGAARDNLLGFHAVSGRGENFKSGGRVVKNVTGFDLSKLMAGSYGTLAVMTEITIKVLPAPEKTRTVLVIWQAGGGHDDDGVAAMTDALTSSHEVTAAAHLPARVAARSAVDYVSGTSSAITAVRVEGPEPSVAYRCNELKSMLGSHAPVEELHSKNSAELWREVRDVSYFAESIKQQVWRLSVPPASGPRVAMTILKDNPGEVFYDWGGGLIWLALDPNDDAGEPVVRAATADVGGYATLIRAAEEVRTRVPVFQPQPEALASITRRVKEGFDPNGVLNPGRMYEGV